MTSVRKRLERLYGPDGADLIEAAPETRIATNAAVPFHVHFQRDPAVGDETLRIVARLDQLQELIADETAITDAGLVHLAGLSQLRLLHLGQTNVTDDGLVHLLALPLVLLDLSGTRVTDAGLVHLHDMISLKEVWIVGCACSREGVERLRSALPGCKVVVSS